MNIPLSTEIGLLAAVRANSMRVSTPGGSSIIYLFDVWTQSPRIGRRPAPAEEEAQTKEPIAPTSSL